MGVKSRRPIYSLKGKARTYFTLLEYGPGMSSFRACRFNSASRALQFSHQTPLSDPGELPLAEPGDPVPKPGEPPSDPGEPVPIPGDMVPGDPEKDPGEDVPDPGEGVPVELGMEPAPSGAGRPPVRDSSYAFRYHVSGEKEADLVGDVSVIYGTIEEYLEIIKTSKTCDYNNDTTNTSSLI